MAESVNLFAGVDYNSDMSDEAFAQAAKSRE